MGLLPPWAAIRENQQTLQGDPPKVKDMFNTTSFCCKL